LSKNILEVLKMVLSEGARAIKNKYARDWYKKNNGMKEQRKIWRDNHKEEQKVYQTRYYEKSF